MHTPVFYIKVGYKGVYITQTCFRDIKVAYTLHRHVFVMSVKEGRKYISFFFLLGVGLDNQS